MEFHDFSPLWWTQTRFGAIVIVMTFLTWGLIIVNLSLACLVLLNKLFTKPASTLVKPQEDASLKSKKNKILALK